MTITSSSSSSGRSLWVPALLHGGSASRRKRRAVACLCVAVLGALGMIAWSAPPASACDNSSSGHCYAIAYAYKADLGVYGQIYLVCQYMPDNGYRLQNEIWDVSTDGAYWTEAGVTSGKAYDNNYYSKHWFWADNRPNGGGYHEHEVAGTANTEVRYPVEIVWAGSDTWEVFGGNSFTLIGQSTPQPLTSSGLMEAGTEYTAPPGNGMRNVGSVYDLEYQSLQGNWYFWGGLGAPDEAGPGAYITPNYNSNQSYVTWTGPC